MSREEELRAMRERRLGAKTPYKKAARLPVDTTVVSTPKPVEPTVVSTAKPRKRSECPACEARRQARRLSMAKWRAKKNG
jgi:hypothetical protein